MRTWIKTILWVVATFIVVWLAAIVYWQNTTRMPAQSELLIYLGIVPLSLIGAGWGIHKAINYKSAAPVDKAAAEELKKDGREAEKAQQEAQQRSWHLNVVAVALQTSAGNSAPEVLAKLNENGVPSDLDPELKNDEGFAVFSNRITDLDVTDTQKALQDWVKTTDFSKLQFSDVQIRALHLARSSLEELMTVASTHPEVQLFNEHLAQEHSPTNNAIPSLKLMLLWPQRWGPQHQKAASHWLKALAAQHGWPERRISLQEITASQSGPFELLDQMCLVAGKTHLPTVGLLLACDSRIDQFEVDLLTSQNMLFGGKNSGGYKPGEVSAGVLIGDERQSRLFESGPLTRLNRASWSSREKSADDRGKISSDLLSAVVVQAMQTAKADVAQVKFVSTDNDHNPNREAELAQMFNATLPELDCIKDALKVAQTCGSAEHVLTVAALCIAHQYVADEQLPALCVSLQSPFLRAAAVLTSAETIQNAVI